MVNKKLVSLIMCTSLIFSSAKFIHGANITSKEKQNTKTNSMVKDSDSKSKPKPKNEAPHLKVKDSSKNIKLYRNSSVFDTKRALNQLKEAWDKEDGGSAKNALACKNSVKVKITDPYGKTISKIDPKSAASGLYTVKFTLVDKITKISANSSLSVGVVNKKATSAELKQSATKEIQLTKEEINNLKKVTSSSKSTVTSNSATSTSRNTSASSSMSTSASTSISTSTSTSSSRSTSTSTSTSTSK